MVLFHVHCQAIHFVAIQRCSNERVFDSAASGSDRQLLRVPEICMVHFPGIRCCSRSDRRGSPGYVFRKLHCWDNFAMRAVHCLRMPALRISGISRSENGISPPDERRSEGKQQRILRRQNWHLDLRGASLCSGDFTHSFQACKSEGYRCFLPDGFSDLRSRSAPGIHC